MELQIKIIGCLFILLALLHIFFPKYFKWKQELSSLSLINRQMMYVHMFFIALLVFLLGLLCLASSDALLHTTLGRRISLGLGIFWTVRLYVQFFVYSGKLWRGKKFETLAHILFSIFWAYVSIIFILGYLSN
ncbi:MAG: hypothetical protein BGO55_17850 [Sphingobacteriales bacterium 50-39]|nr:MAG: hypothetical protein BGO55_17850 [Sphingobacteriales bacterium 50-39]